LDPDITHGQLQSGAQAAQTLKPAAQCVAVVTLTAEGVMSAEAVMDVGGAVLENGAVLMLVDALEVFGRDPLDDRVVHSGVLSRGVLHCQTCPPRMSELFDT